MPSHELPLNEPPPSTRPGTWQSLGRSAVSSGAATLLDGLIAWSLALLLAVPGATATLIGALAGGMLNWLLNRFWAFGSSGAAGPEATRYALVSAAAALLNTLGVAWLEGPLGFRLAWLLTRCAVFLAFTFVLFRNFVFRHDLAAPAQASSGADASMNTGVDTSPNTTSDTSRNAWSAPWVFAVPPVLVVLGVLRGVRVEYLAAALATAVLIAIGPRTRRFAALAMPFAAVGVLYDHFDLMNGFRGAIHVGDLFRAEQWLFGIPSNGARVVPAIWLGQHTHRLLDLACGFSYMAYLYEVFFVGAWLYLRRDEVRMSTLAWAFLGVNLLGMLIWLAFPAAPPWYVTQYGTGPARLDALPSAAGAARFDAALGIHYFSGFYARSRNVFGAMPSLHVAYPTLVFLVLRERGRIGALFAFAFALLVAFSAVYLGHHYVLDVLGGVFVALAAYALARVLVHRAMAATVDAASVTPGSLR